MKKLKYAIALTLLTSLNACESSDLPVQHADGYKNINFAMEAQEMETRANGYEAYDPTKHPESMGVFGYYDPSNNIVFSNTQVNYNTNSKNWVYEIPKQWNQYPQAKAFNFFAYMPFQASGTSSDTSGTASSDASETTSSAPSLTLKEGSANTYTLSFPFAMPSATAPFLYDTKSAPIICANGVNRAVKDASGKAQEYQATVSFQFDQTLVGYNLLFKLDSKMEAIRQFRIKKVSISGKILTAGTISRDYTYNTNTQQWTSDKIKWIATTQTTYEKTSPILISQSDSSKDTESNITSAEYSPWGKTFYAIPDAKFNPTISVTYDVEFVDQGKQIVTRKDITSDIVLNSTHFKELNTTGTATINNIRILIQPRYLYVLTDDDAYTGYLLIE